jgi:hypothetical protein
MRSHSIVAVAIFAMLAVLAAGCAAARAADADLFAKRLFAGDDATQNHKHYACFVRRYDAAHLARHAQQKVSGMKLLVTAEKMPEDEALNYSFRFGIKFRHRRGNFDSSGDCGHPLASAVSADKMHLGCNVDCDGGGVSIELAHRDRSTLVRLDRIRIWQNNMPDDESLDLNGGAEDRVFRLDRAKLDECRSLITDRKELAAMRHK